MAAERISVLDTVGEAVRFARTGRRAAIVPLTLGAVFGMASLMGQYTAHPALALLSILQILSSIMAVSAMLQGALPGAPEQSSPPQPPRLGGLQWGMNEWRLTGSIALLALVFALMAALGIFIAAAMLMSSGSIQAIGALRPGLTQEDLVRVLGPQRMEALALLYLAFTLVALWIWVRLSLYAPATIASRTVAVFDSWGLTRGRFWPMFFVILLTFLPSFTVWFVVGGLQGALGGRADGTVSLPLAVMLAALASGVASFVQLPLSTGAYFALYRRLSHRGR